MSGSSQPVWFEFINTDALGERHTGLTARVGPLEGDAVVGEYEDRGHLFRVGDTQFSKADYDLIQIEEQGNAPEEIVMPERESDGE